MGQRRTKRQRTKGGQGRQIRGASRQAHIFSIQEGSRDDKRHRGGSKAVTAASQERKKDGPPERPTDTNDRTGIETD